MAALATAPQVAGTVRHEHVCDGPGIEGDRVIVLTAMSALVASKSEPGVWHRTGWVDGQPHCTCKGFQYRGACRHHRAVNEAVVAERGSEGRF
jgi:hypothetical protein